MHIGTNIHTCTHVDIPHVRTHACMHKYTHYTYTHACMHTHTTHTHLPTLPSQSAATILCETPAVLPKFLQRIVTRTKPILFLGLCVASLCLKHKSSVPCYSFTARCNPTGMRGATGRAQVGIQGSSLNNAAALRVTKLSNLIDC